MPADVPAVVVLNDSRIGGLARAAATRVEAAGFVVDRVGNYRGMWNTPATTLYYEPGHEAAAQVLRARLPGVVRIANIDDTQIPRYGKLLLVVTKEFPVPD
nr:LytR C-terminal domain-containing protein [Micromonospora sp. DSM 115978]